MKLRQQSSTSYPITFLMVDSADHVTGKTGLTPTVTISKNGGSFASPSGAVSEIGSGWYALAGNATDRGTLGDLLVHATGTGADPVDDRYCIVPWNPFDATNLGLAHIDAAMSTRLPTASYAAPLDAAGTRAAVGLATANLDEQLSDILDVESDIQSRLPVALVSGRMDASVGAMGSNIITIATMTAQWWAELFDTISGMVSGTGDWVWTRSESNYTTPGTFGNIFREIAGRIRTELATELARIDEDVSAGAHAGDAMTLADNAITAAKYDESTAFPLAQADAGSTAVARAGADGDTLKALSDEIASIEAGSGLTAQETANAVHNLAPVGLVAANSIGDKLNDMPGTILTTVVAAYANTPGTFGYLLSLLAGLDFTAVNLVAASNTGEITLKRTLTLAAVVSGLTIPADWTACYWTVKRSVDDADADALVQILASNPPDADDGLLILDRAAVEDETAGSLTVSQALGTVTIALDDASTAALEDAVELVWDVKVHAPAGKTQPGAGTATITTAVTRA